MTGHEWGKLCISLSHWIFRI